MAVGIVLLTYLSLHYYQVLKMLLGGVVILAGTMLMISPSPWETQSKKASIIFFGSLGGILAGLYSAGGAPLAYFLYRQPLSINVIRFSLLAIFGASTAIRSVMIGVSGQLTLEILKMSLLAIPIVVLITLGTSKIVPYIPDRAVRMAVFVVLIAAGAMLLAGDYIDLSIHKVSQN
jgi:uncharacterized membrane protein YfcA